MTPVEPPVKRRYDTSKRRQAAARTRQAILAAALELFTDRGYTATPMTAIAERAGVALDTVYAAVGRKAELARLLIETAISGGSQAVPAEERDYVQAIRQPRRGDQDRYLRIGYARHRRPPGAGPFHHRAGRVGRTRAGRVVAPDLRAPGGEHAPVRRRPRRRRRAARRSRDAADIVWATNAPELYQLLVSQRGWSPERYERFLAETAPPAPPR